MTEIINLDEIFNEEDREYIHALEQKTEEFKKLYKKYKNCSQTKANYRCERLLMHKVILYGTDRIEEELKETERLQAKAKAAYDRTSRKDVNPELQEYIRLTKKVKVLKASYKHYYAKLEKLSPEVSKYNEDIKAALKQEEMRKSKNR